LPPVNSAALNGAFSVNTREAKNFLVEQAAEQAALEKESLSDVEKRMMYFTESDPSSCDNAIDLNDEFEAQYDTAEYEAKVSRLLHHAYARLKGEDSEKVRRWEQSIRILRKGDHYILVLWDVKAPGDRPAGDSLKLLGAGLLVATAIVVASFVAAKYNISLDRLRNSLPAPNPRFALVLFVGVFVLALVGTRLFNWLLMAWVERRGRQKKESE
jgi:hypothetical protein